MQVMFDMVQVFKILNNFDKVDKNIWFRNVNDTQVATRHRSDPNNLTRQYVSRTDIRQNFFSQRVINTWNSLPVHVKESTTVKSFKKRYYNHTKNVHIADVPGNR